MRKLLLPMFCGVGDLTVDRCDRGIIITSKQGRVLIPAEYALVVAAGIVSAYGEPPSSSLPDR